MADIKITKENVSNVLSFTDEIVKNYPGRLVGSEACTEAGKRIAVEYAKNCDAGTVKREAFTCHPNSFIKYIRPVMIMYISGLFFTFIKRPILAAISYILPISIITSQFLLYKKIFDPFFKKETGYSAGFSALGPNIPMPPFPFLNILTRCSFILSN